MRKSIRAKLKVYPLFQEDVFKDIARIGRADRGPIEEGSVCKISANGHTRQLIVRGLGEQLPGVIMLDEYTRESMGKIETGFSYDFFIEESDPLAQVWWACTIADRGARISAWIGVASVGLGIVGLILGLIGVWIAEHPPH
jgi:hypothetical protein